MIYAGCYELVPNAPAYPPPADRLFSNPLLRKQEVDHFKYICAHFHWKPIIVPTYFYCCLPGTFSMINISLETKGYYCIRSSAMKVLSPVTMMSPALLLHQTVFLHPSPPFFVSLTSLSPSPHPLFYLIL